MKKHILKLALSTFAVLALASCGNVGSDTTSKNNDNTVSSVVENTTSASTVDESLKVKTLDDVCTYLVSKNIVSGEKSTKSASMIGAIAGYGYSDSGIEIYEYSGNAPEKFTVIGIEMSFDATNKQFAMMYSSGYEVDATTKNNAIAAFKAMIVE